MAPETDRVRGAAGAASGAGLMDPVDGITQALGALAAVNRYLTARPQDDPTADDATLRTVLVGLGHIDAAATAARARAIVAAEDARLSHTDGAASTTAWVADQLRLTAADAARECRLAARLDDLPQVLADLERGVISRDHAAQLVAALVQQQHDHDAAERVRLVAQEQARRDREAAAARDTAAAADEADRRDRQRRAAERERALREEEARQQAARRAQAERAQQQRLADLQGRAAAGDSPDAVRDEAQQRRTHDPDAMAREAAAQQHRRSARNWRDRDTGMGMIRAALPGDSYEAYLAAIQATKTFDPPEVPVEERRTSEQREADAFIDIIEAALRAGELPTSGGVKPHVTAYAPVETLLGTADLPGTGRFGTDLAAETIRRLACDSGLVRAITNATSMVLDVGRETRVWSTAQRRAVELRDGGCRFPVAEGRNCGRPIGWCDVHHVEWWRHGGDTDTDNGVLLCGHHHRLVHHGGWDMTFNAETGEVTATRRLPGRQPVTRTSPPCLPSPPRGRPPETPAQPTLPMDDQRQPA